MLSEAGVRHTVAPKETLGYRIREAETLKIPYMAVVGEREAADGTVAVRRRGAGKKQEVMDRDAFVQKVRRGDPCPGARLSRPRGLPRSMHGSPPGRVVGAPSAESVSARRSWRRRRAGWLRR